MKINNMDDLALFETQELEQMQSRYRDQIKHIRRHGGDTGYAEIELSYVQRELHIRELREISSQNFRNNGFQSANYV